MALKVFALGKTFLTLRGFGMIVYRRRLGWGQRPTRRMVKRT
jgi:hypothetical protein